jgi:hypothetical protein
MLVVSLCPVMCKIFNSIAQVVIHASSIVNGNNYDGKFKLFTKSGVSVRVQTKVMQNWRSNIT